MAQRALKLGTRRSALARAQANAVARQLERLHPQVRVELVGIDTRGDRVQDRPLAGVPGKEFFSAEIDAALERGDVDFTVHSFKDLSLDRSEHFRLAAVPARRPANDVALFAPDIVSQLARGEPIVVGSCSPRRVSFVPALLPDLLPPPALAPRPPSAARVRLVDLRGNVDTRLRRLREPRGSQRHLDAVVLAFAGIARLWADTDARSLLEPLLKDLPRMVLPLSASPGAPAQGALALECRADDAATAALLSGLDHAPTRQAAEAERALLAQRGGGCQQRFGASQRSLDGLGTLLYWREALEREGTTSLEPPRLCWTPPQPLPRPNGPIRAWDGSRAPPAPSRPLEAGVRLAEATLPQSTALFVAHRRAWPDAAQAWLRPGAAIWVPGLASWRALACRGLWIQGCTDGLGFAAARELLAEPWLGLPELQGWTVLTHAEAEAGWREPPPAGSEVAGDSSQAVRAGKAAAPGPRVIATYEHVPGSAPPQGPPPDSTHVFWASGTQFERFRHLLAEGVEHATGPGRSYEHLRQAGVHNLRMFPDAQQWREWLGT